MSTVAERHAISASIDPAYVELWHIVISGNEFEAQGLFVGPTGKVLMHRIPHIASETAAEQVGRRYWPQARKAPDRVFWRRLRQVFPGPGLPPQVTEY